MADPCAVPGLLAVDEARARLRAAAVPVTDTESVLLAEATGRVLAEDIVARVDVPPADNSAVDGYAVRLADLQAAQGHLPVSQRIPAGRVPQPLAAGTAARIFTGGEIPPGADAVVMQEDCSGDGATVTVASGKIARVMAGDNVRPCGQDMRAGTVVLTARTRLGPPEIGVLAASGHAAATVFRRLRVAFFSTGDELLEPGSAPVPGRIYNSNRHALRAYLAQAGCAAIDLGVVPDSLPATREALRRAVGAADVVLTTGGVSVGEEDHVQAALRASGTVDLWKVAIKPGKPLLLGHVDEGGRRVPVLGLPGNPVAVAVTFLVLALPMLQAMQGRLPARVPSFRLPAGFAVRRAGNRTEYLRVRLGEGSAPRLERFPNQSSGVLTSLSWADGLAVVPAGMSVGEGDLVEYLPFSAFF